MRRETAETFSDMGSAGHCVRTRDIPSSPPHPPKKKKEKTNPHTTGLCRVQVGNMHFTGDENAEETSVLRPFVYQTW